MLTDYSYADVAKMIDHALLSPNLKRKQFDDGIAMALAYDVASVCIQPHYLARCAEKLGGSTVKASTVIGFPHGGHATSVKAIEAKQALLDGAEELDMVVNVSRVLSEDWDYVAHDIVAVLEPTHQAGQKLKVIFETAYLEDEHKRRLCELCGELGVDWVKTSTGFAPGGATPEDLLLMRRHSPPRVQVKASGGIRTLDGLLEARTLGATRVGASATVAILSEARRRLGLASLEIDSPGDAPEGY